MQRCLQLAAMGAGTVSPNPMVGAVLVHDDRIIGEGYHQQYGQAHAEVNCINSVPEQQQHLFEKSTMYVSLEPCAHFGKTPPCANLLIDKKIPRVVIACRDSYKEVAGRGIQLLKNAGVEVTVGLLEKEAQELNRRFFKYHEAQRPYIILKWAQSNNSRIANADLSRVMISNDYSNRLVHRWRSEEAAIMVGFNTALHDDPSLTNRHWYGNDPVRILLDRNLEVPATHQLMADGGKSIIFNQLRNEDAGNILFRKIEKDKPAIRQVLKQLYELKIQSVLVEGGAALLQSFIDESCWDEARVITNQQLVIRNGLHSPVLNNHSLIKTALYLSDHIHYYTHSVTHT